MMRLMQIVELAPGMGPTGGFDDASGFIKPVETRIAIGLQNALVILQVTRRMLALAIRRVGKPDCRSLFTTSGSIVSNIRPQAPGLGLSPARLKHRNGHIIAMDLLTA